MTDASKAGVVRAAARAAPAGVLRGIRGIRWFVTELMGDRAYATYLDHHRRTHPGQPALDERAFWRQRYAEQDANPGARCC
ncbi:YbdD/YjiX family protein [Agromyces larvae]|nr:YbdD/YjiX family protein [Agromyces larvae]